MDYCNYIYEVVRYKLGKKIDFNQFSSTNYNIPYESVIKYNDLFRSYVKSNKPNNVLEIGSGFGSVLISLATEFHDISFVGVDTSDLRIKNCKQKSKNLENIQFNNYNCSQLDSLGLKFDLALVDKVFMYVSHN